MREAPTRARAATELYRSGLGSYLQVLSPDQSLAGIEAQVAHTEGERVRDLVAMYEALGAADGRGPTAQSSESSCSRCGFGGSAAAARDGGQASALV
jgi:outer membrane protein TolC